MPTSAKVASTGWRALYRLSGSLQARCLSCPILILCAGYATMSLSCRWQFEARTRQRQTSLGAVTDQLTRHLDGLGDGHGNYLYLCGDLSWVPLFCPPLLFMRVSRLSLRISRLGMALGPSWLWPCDRHGVGIGRWARGDYFAAVFARARYEARSACGIASDNRPWWPC